MNKIGLDEMQLQRKNKIGNQTFLMLLYLLLLDTGLYGFGFRWISYPANVMIILTICSGSYVIRLITGNAYVGPSAAREKPILKAAISVLGAVAVAIAMIALLRNANFSTNSQIDVMSAPILFITAAIALIIVVVTSFIKKAQNKNERD